MHLEGKIVVGAMIGVFVGLVVSLTASDNSSVLTGQASGDDKVPMGETIHLEARKESRIRQDYMLAEASKQFSGKGMCTIHVTGEAYGQYEVLVRDSEGRLSSIIGGSSGGGVKKIYGGGGGFGDLTLTIRAWGAGFLKFIKVDAYVTCELCRNGEYESSFEECDESMEQEYPVCRACRCLEEFVSDGTGGCECPSNLEPALKQKKLFEDFLKNDVDIIGWERVCPPDLPVWSQEENKCVKGPDDEGDNCTTDDDCADNDLCTVNKCERGECVNSPRVCPDTDNNVCTQTTCLPFTGECIDVQVSGCCNTDGECDDKDKCTDDFCIGNTCSNIAPNCSDGKDCTNDFCDPSTGECRSIIGEECDDNIECTIDTCTEDGCKHDDSACCQSDAACANGNACNTCSGPCERLLCTCVDGTCQNNPVTDGSCDTGACNPWPPSCGNLGAECGKPEESCTWCTLESVNPEDGARKWTCSWLPNAEIIYPDQCGGGPNSNGSSQNSSKSSQQSSKNSSDSDSVSSLSSESSLSSSFSESLSFSSSISGASSSSGADDSTDDGNDDFSDGDDGDDTGTGSVSSILSSSFSSLLISSSSDEADDGTDEGDDAESQSSISSSAIIQSSSSSSYEKCDFCPACLACRRCGLGIGNVCDAGECGGLGICVFEDGLFVNSCNPDPDVCSVCR